MQDVSDGLAQELAPAARLAALGELAGGTVHAVNNALFAILAHVELALTDGAADEATLERLRVVHETGLGLRETLQRLGALARGDERPGRARLDVEVRETLELLRGTSRVAEASSSLPAEELPVAAAPADVAQIVAHVLIDAASRAGRRGTLAVEVAAEGGAAVLRVRASGEPEPRPDGGLGIVVARALAERLGGSLEVDEETVTRLSLPLPEPVRESRAGLPRHPR